MTDTDRAVLQLVEAKLIDRGFTPPPAIPIALDRTIAEVLDRINSDELTVADLLKRLTERATEWLIDATQPEREKDHRCTCDAWGYAGDLLDADTLDDRELVDREWAAAIFEELRAAMSAADDEDPGEAPVVAPLGGFMGT
jgi:hypothetical protein